jgi:hypothetical protein
MTLRNAPAWCLLVLFAVLALAACSADPPCVLGTRGWCENEMAAAAVRAVSGSGEGQVDAAAIVVVEDGFSVDRSRLSAERIVPLAAERVDPYLATQSFAIDRTVVVISDVHIVNAPAPGNAVAQGTATVTYYQGGRKIRSETLRGTLNGRTFTITERK